MLTFHAIGDWPRGHVRLTASDKSFRRIVPEVERIIDESWQRVLSRPGVHLFDGPMCRMESFEASPDALSLVLSTTSYKPFVGTNLQNPHLADAYGPDVMGNPVGVSTLLETADGHLMLGRRNASVAYYPDRVHPFAGALEPRDGADPFTAVYRELAEELSLAPEDLTDLHCRGLVEDHALRQPELVFLGRTKLMSPQVERRVDRDEHHACWSVPLRQSRVSASVSDPQVTPVGVALLLLAGLNPFGERWFEKTSASLGLLIR